MSANGFTITSMAKEMAMYMPMSEMASMLTSNSKDARKAK